MNRLLLKFLLLPIIMISGYQHQVDKKIEVTGKALNAMGGAVVTGADKYTYYVEGLDHWDKKFYGKEVKVSGVLVLENSPKKDYPKPGEQVIAGGKRIIKSPKWQLIE